MLGPPVSTKTDARQTKDACSLTRGGVRPCGWRPRSGFEVQYDDLVQIDARYHELPRPCSRPERGALQRETSAAHAEQTVDPNGYVPDRRHLLEVEIGGLVLLGHRERGQG